MEVSRVVISDIKTLIQHANLPVPSALSALQSTRGSVYLSVPGLSAQNRT